MIRYFVGVPGCGKTTMACKLLKKNIKSSLIKKLTKQYYEFNFANFENRLSNQVNVALLARFKLPQRSYLSIDESGLEFNCRGHKTLDPGFIEFFKMHRHEKCDIDLFSQTWDDTDKQIRDLAAEIWVLKKIGPISFARCVYKRIDISDDHKLEYQHYWKSILWQLLPFQPKQFIFCFRPMYYKYFNSFEPMQREILPADFVTNMDYIIK